MPPPEGEQRNQSVININLGRRPIDRRRRDDFDNRDFPETGGRPPIMGDSRLPSAGQLFVLNEDYNSNIPAYKIQADGLVPFTLVMDAAERAEFRNMATAWEIQNSPVCIASHSYQPVLDD